MRGAEGVRELELGLDHGRQPAHSLADAVRLGVAVGQPQVLPALPVDVEAGAGHVRDEVGDGARQHGRRVEAVRQREPRVEAAGRDGPARALGHERLQRLQERVAALPVDLLERLDLLAPGLGGQVLGDGELRVVRRAQHRRLVGQHQLLAHAVRRHGPADPQPGGDRLGERPEVDDAVGVVGADRARGLALEAQQPVRVVLEDGDARRLRDGEDLGASRRTLRDAGGVVEARDRVDQLDPLAGRARGGDRLGQGARHQALVVHGDVDDVALVRAEDAEGAHVRRCLDEDDVAGIAEDADHEVEGHLRSGGHDDVVRMGGDADLADHLEDLLAERDVALARAVLEGLRAALVQQSLRRVGQHVDGQGLHVRHAAGQRDDLGSRGDGEQGPDLRRPHGVGATGIRVHPWIEPGTSGHANHLASASSPLTWRRPAQGRLARLE